jgi:hypothetical protein
MILVLRSTDPIQDVDLLFCLVLYRCFLPMDSEGPRRKKIDIYKKEKSSLERGCFKELGVQHLAIEKHYI